MESSNFPAAQITESIEEIWGIPYQSVGCSNCKQVFLIHTTKTREICPNCGAHKLESQPALLRTESPENIIPFQKKVTDLSGILSNFMKGVWLRSKDFNVATMLSRVTPVYWPMWLVDCDLSGDWTAEIGFDYQVKSSQESYTQNGWRSNEIIENRIRWEPRLGQIDRHYDNVASPANSDYSYLNACLGEYRLDLGIPYQPALIKGTILKIPDLHPESAWSNAQPKVNKLAGKDCMDASGGKHLRNFSIDAVYQKLNWSILLMPMYSTYYTDDNGNLHPVFINGQTGVMGGPRLASQKKGWQIAGISLVIAVGILLMALLCFVFSTILPLITILGILLVILALTVGVFSITAAIWPWQWNRNQQATIITVNRP
jgi:hypothetical protein